MCSIITKVFDYCNKVCYLYKNKIFYNLELTFQKNVNFSLQMVLIGNFPNPCLNIFKLKCQQSPFSSLWLKSWRTISYKKNIEIIFSVFLDIAFIRNLCNSKKSKKNRTSYHRLYIQSSKSMQDLSAWFEFSLIYITKPAGKIRALRRSSLFITHYVAVRCLSHPSFYLFFILFLWVFPFVGSFRFYFFREFFILFWLFSSVVSFLFCCKFLLLFALFCFLLFR